MKFCLIDPETREPVKPEKTNSVEPVLGYLPRVKCNDCLKRVYAAGPGHTADKFEKHLKFRDHKDVMEKKRQREKGGG
jgi:SWI/SNF-related matrix-associated actin-dependent regulator of chromatin subfamily B member 1